jgi:hypothetical protein
MARFKCQWPMPRAAETRGHAAGVNCDTPDSAILGINAAVADLLREWATETSPVLHTFQCLS